MLGKRENCHLETLLLSLPLLAVGLAVLRRLAPLDRALSGAVLGAGAGAIPALLMQIACM